MSTPDPVAWLLRPKVQRYPQKPMIRGVMTTRPTPENLEFAELDGDEYVPLYAAVPKREPLTEEQIDELIRAEHFRRWSKTPPEPVSLAKFARVVEAAHGIKGSE